MTVRLTSIGSVALSALLLAGTPGCTGTLGGLRTYQRHSREAARLEVLEQRLREIRTSLALVNQMLTGTPYTPGASWISKLRPTSKDLEEVGRELRASGFEPPDTRLSAVSLYSAHIRNVLGEAEREKRGLQVSVLQALAASSADGPRLVQAWSEYTEIRRVLDEQVLPTLKDPRKLLPAAGPKHAPTALKLQAPDPAPESPGDSNELPTERPASPAEASPSPIAGAPSPADSPPPPVDSPPADPPPPPVDAPPPATPPADSTPGEAASPSEAAPAPELPAPAEPQPEPAASAPVVAAPAAVAPGSLKELSERAERARARLEHELKTFRPSRQVLAQNAQVLRDTLTLLNVVERLESEALFLMPVVLRQSYQILSHPSAASDDPLRAVQAAQQSIEHVEEITRLLRAQLELVTQLASVLKNAATPDLVADTSFTAMPELKWSDFVSAQGEASYIYQLWRPRSIPDVAYNTAGANILRLQGGVEFAELPFAGKLGLHGSYEMTPGSSADQARLVQLTEKEKQAWEAYAADVSLLLPFSKPLGTWHSLESHFDRKTFLVAAQALKDYWYYRDGGVDLLVPGDTISTSTTMTTFDLGWRAQRTRRGLGGLFTELGGFYLEFRKPYAHDLFTTVSRSAIFDSSFRGYGLGASLGHDFHPSARGGPLRVELRTKLGMAEILLDDASAAELLPESAQINVFEGLLRTDVPLFRVLGAEGAFGAELTYRTFGDFLGTTDETDDSKANTASLNDDIVFALLVRLAYGQ